MPLPTRRKDEEKSDFMSRCVSDPKMLKEFPDIKQRIAVCVSQNKKKKK